MDTSDWQLHPRVFRYLEKEFGKHTVDRFASRENRQLPRYNAKWRDGTLDDLAAKLRQSGAAAIVIAPKWPRFPQYQQLAEMAAETVEMPPARNLFSPQRQKGHAGVGPSAWIVAAFKLPRRPGCS